MNTHRLDEKLPIEHGFREALKIYLERLVVFISVCMGFVILVALVAIILESSVVLSSGGSAFLILGVVALFCLTALIAVMFAVWCFESIFSFSSRDMACIFIQMLSVVIGFVSLLMMGTVLLVLSGILAPVIIRVIALVGVVIFATVVGVLYTILVLNRMPEILRHGTRRREVGEREGNHTKVPF